MQLGFVGLGRMGANMVRRLTRGGHECVIHARRNETSDSLAAETGATIARSLEEFADLLAPPRSVWLMVPAGKATAEVIEQLSGVLDAGDTIIDGGNSLFKQSAERASQLRIKGIDLLDCGTSGGVFGLERGYSLMVGGDPHAAARHAGLFDTLAPGVGAAERTPARASGPVKPVEHGWLYCGPSGAGHYVKMVHNGIEYGMMQAMAEGLAILASAGVDTLPEAERYEFDLAEISEVWRRGSVVSSWLLDLTADALAGEAGLDAYSPRVADSGEGRWTVQAAVDQGTAAPVITAALFARFASHDDAGIAPRILSAMRAQFGGHAGVPAPNATSSEA